MQRGEHRDLFKPIFDLIGDDGSGRELRSPVNNPVSDNGRMLVSQFSQNLTHSVVVVRCASAGFPDAFHDAAAIDGAGFGIQEFPLDG